MTNRRLEPHLPSETARRIQSHEERAKALDTLARTLYGEAERDDLEDVEAIACVVLNRVHLPNWPNDITAVCLQPLQFSCWNANDPNRERIVKATTADEWFRTCQDVAARAVAGQLVDRTHRSTHYYATYIGVPYWAKGHTPVYETAKGKYNHLFFNDIDTPPPQDAREALDQERPLSTTRTVRGGGVAAAGTVLAAAAEWLEEAKPHVLGLIQFVDWAKYILLAVVLIGVLGMLYARVQDRKEGLR